MRVPPQIQALLIEMPAKPKVILIFRLPSENFGGVEKQILTIASWLRSAASAEPVLATSDGASLLAEAFRGLGLTVETLGQRGTPALEMARRLRAIAYRRNAVCIQSHHFRESVVGSAARLQVRQVRHIFRVHTYIDCSWIPQWKKWSYHALARLAECGVDHYLPITRAAERELLKSSLIRRDKITVVPDGVPQLGPADGPEPGNGPLPARVAMVANLTRHKGHDVLIRGLAALKRRGIIVRARLVGGEAAAATRQSGHGCPSPASPEQANARTRGAIDSSSFAAELKRASERLGVADQIEFYGFTTDVYSAVKEYPVVVLPSDSEGMPNCILEAMSLRKIVVASSVGGVPEFIKHGDNGFLHPAQDHEAFALALVPLFTMPAAHWEPLRDRALSTWKANFSVEAMVSGLRTVYQRMGVVA